MSILTVIMWLFLIIRISPATGTPVGSQVVGFEIFPEFIDILVTADAWVMLTAIHNNNKTKRIVREFLNNAKDRVDVGPIFISKFEG